MASSELDRLIALYDRPIEPVFRIKGNKAFKVPNEYVVSYHNESESIYILKRQFSS